MGRWVATQMASAELLDFSCACYRKLALALKRENHHLVNPLHTGLALTVPQQIVFIECLSFCKYCQQHTGRDKHL